MSVVTSAPPPIARRWTTTRIGGMVFLGFWIACALAVLASFYAGYDADFVARYVPRLLKGLQTTLHIVIVSVIVGGLLSIPVAIARSSANRVFKALALIYIDLFRGAPLLAQIFLIYYGAGQFRGTLEALGLWWFFRDALNCALLSFSLNTAAYQAEIYRGAFQSVARGQWEAGRALGLRDWVIVFKIILPQATMIALRPVGNEIILVIKGSAIASIITVLDLMGHTRLAFSRSLDFQVYLWAALLYLTVVEVLRRVIAGLEARLTRHLVR